MNQYLTQISAPIKCSCVYEHFLGFLYKYMSQNNKCSVTQAARVQAMVVGILIMFLSLIIILV